MKIWTVFVTSKLDKYGTVFAAAHYDNYEAAQTHRDHITKAIKKNNPLQIQQVFVGDIDVHSNFEGE